jgi:ureidoglycolate hydrolase
VLPHKILRTEQLTPEAFAPYGQIIAATEDGTPFGADDAQLDLCHGTPRFYIMRLDARPLEVQRITRHLKVTQCLASVGGKPWWLVVAPPTPETATGQTPAIDTIRAFNVGGDVAVKLHLGAWHAGPYFTGSSASFFNLELSDTNLIDHHSLNLSETYGHTFSLEP